MQFELNKKTRENEILRVVQTTEPVMTGIKLPIRPDKVFNVHKVPIEMLVYNHLNDRFASKSREHEIDTGERLSVDSQENLLLIEKFIWESNITSNQETIKDLAQNGQLKYGIITEDGRIIDGNRRASLIRRIYYSDSKDFPNINKENFRYFLCVVLPGNISDDEMLVLETKIQMGEDDKVDYNPVEKYLKVDKLVRSGKTYDEIAGMIKSVKNGKAANEMHDIYKLMVRYLEYIEAPNHFSIISKYEDHFIKLNKTIEYFRNGTYSANWRPKESDFIEFEQVAFHYIRKGHEGKDFRNLMGGKTDQKGIFSNLDVWGKFVKKHDSIIDEANDDLKRKNFDNVIQREDYWINKTSSKLDTIFRRAKESINNRDAENKPKDLAEGALEKLQLIDIDLAIFRYEHNGKDQKTIQDLYKILSDINKMTEQMKDKIVKDVFKKN